MDQHARPVLTANGQHAADEAVAMFLAILTATQTSHETAAHLTRTALSRVASAAAAEPRK
jgi:hypothetical protein